MNTLTIYLSSPTLSAGDLSTTLSAAPVKGRTNVTLDFTGFDESQWVVNDLRIEWGDSGIPIYYKRDPVANYKTTSIFDEVLYGKIGGSIMKQYSHIYNTTSAADITVYLIEIFAWYENGYRHDISMFLPVYPESYYDSLDELDLVTTQMLPISTNHTVANFESRSSGQTLVCILSS